MSKNATILTLTLFLAALFSMPALVGNAEPGLFSGELSEVNIDTQTLVVQDADGNSMEFRFTEETEILGTQGVQGLSGETGSWVRVHYSDDGSVKTATRIEVQEG